MSTCVWCGGEYDPTEEVKDFIAEGFCPKCARDMMDISPWNPDDEASGVTSIERTEIGGHKVEIIQERKVQPNDAR